MVVKDVVGDFKTELKVRLRAKIGLKELEDLLEIRSLSNISILVLISKTALNIVFNRMEKVSKTRSLRDRLQP